MYCIINPSAIGFLAMRTQTQINKSEGVKMLLMEVYDANTDVKGVDVKNACFGSTQALFHVVGRVYANWQTETNETLVGNQQPGNAAEWTSELSTRDDEQQRSFEKTTVKNSLQSFQPVTIGNNVKDTNDVKG
ncbi:unnamed protein product [Toxocara canis]|uniref:HMG_CoA_synt_N domain-containing protein n=1 Tax=Toxocara canis TaxID=6265 RepID=A0A183VG23_TOXCA|nr:unnamed protein product [Toxocara canis]